ncbi:MAG: hypothetical protein P8N43_13705 [Alphaproteobacteria bacterium]|nr:hypothetical protein [Alphaproteobacteria bacterium]
MKKSQTVIISINSDDQTRCVDVFARADGSYGFEEYRRDPEDTRGWFPIGGFADLTFEQQEHAMAKARARVNWLTLLNTR